jgi:hypothetical protein
MYRLSPEFKAVRPLRVEIKWSKENCPVLYIFNPWEIFDVFGDILGQVLGPAGGGKRLYSEDEAYLNERHFEFKLSDITKRAQAQAVLVALALFSQVPLVVEHDLWPILDDPTYTRLQKQCFGPFRISNPALIKLQVEAALASNPTERDYITARVKVYHAVVSQAYAPQDQGTPVLMQNALESITYAKVNTSRLTKTTFGSVTPTPFPLGFRIPYGSHTIVYRPRVQQGAAVSLLSPVSV